MDELTFEECKLEGVDANNHERPRRVRFRGVVVLEDDHLSTFYVTSGKKVVVETGRGPHEPPLLKVFDSYEEFRDAYIELERHDAVQAVAEAMGEEYFEDLDAAAPPRRSRRR